MLIDDSTTGIVGHNLVKSTKKRKRYTNEFKINCVDLLNNEGWRQVEEKEGVKPNLVYKWKNILEVLEKSESKHKRIKLDVEKHNTVLPRESEIELYQKILNLRQMGIAVNGKLVQLYAIKYATEHQLQSFKAGYDCINVDSISL